AMNEISQSAKFYLKNGGYFLVEHGFLQGKTIRELFAQEGYVDVYSVCDLSGHERVTLGRWYY
ncbi:MAG: protein-(glutamine-N5) methyltransferase, release factor-specific, partial [Gammaproteobacteria bacterium]|nr:protein-(glutamine-N5) methyltransferase, release factor-specific [Gammaproteobacteria bacterium]